MNHNSIPAGGEDPGGNKTTQYKKNLITLPEARTPEALQEE